MKLSEAIYNEFKPEIGDYVSYGNGKVATVFDNQGMIAGYTKMGAVLTWDETGQSDIHSSLNLRMGGFSQVYRMHGLKVEVRVIAGIPYFLFNASTSRWKAFEGNAQDVIEVSDCQVAKRGLIKQKCDVIPDVEIFIGDDRMTEKLTPTSILRVFTLRGEVCYETV